jgi:hypothetical protein
MEIKLSNEESEMYFYNALCNGLDYIGGYGLELEVNLGYIEAKRTLEAKNETEFRCHEDILMEVLRSGGKLTLIDHENDGEETSITIEDVHNKVQNTDIDHLMDMINERDDACTADVILQTVFFGDVIFG